MSRPSGHVLLRPVIAQDVDFIRALELSPSNIVRYRQRGAATSPEEFHARLWTGVFHQVVAVDRSNGERLGVLAGFGADWRNAHAHIAFIFTDAAQASGAAAVATVHFIDYVFDVFPLRKVYGEVLELNLPQFQSAIGRCAQVEGRKRLHEWYEGRYWDQVTLAVYREGWARWRTGNESRASNVAELSTAVEEILGDVTWHADDRIVDLQLDSLARLEVNDVIDALELPSDADELTVGQLFAHIRRDADGARS